MSVSVDGFIADRDGAFEWTAPSEELFRFHTALVSELGGYLLGRRLYETMLVWETDPSMRDDELRAAFADVWCAIPKVVFSRTLDSVQGNARLAEASLAEEAAAALDATDKDVSIGGAGLAAQATELGLVDELAKLGSGSQLRKVLDDQGGAHPDHEPVPEVEALVDPVADVEGDDDREGEDEQPASAAVVRLGHAIPPWSLRHLVQGP